MRPLNIQDTVYTSICCWGRAVAIAVMLNCIWFCLHCCCSCGNSCCFCCVPCCGNSCCFCCVFCCCFGISCCFWCCCAPVMELQYCSAASFTSPSISDVIISKSVCSVGNETGNVSAWLRVVNEGLQCWRRPKPESDAWLNSPMWVNAVGLISGFVRLFSRKSSRSTFKSGKTGTLSESLLDWEDSNKQFFFWAELSGDETSLLPEFVFDEFSTSDFLVFELSSKTEFELCRFFSEAEISLTRFAEDSGLSSVLIFCFEGDFWVLGSWDFLFVMLVPVLGPHFVFGWSFFVFSLAVSYLSKLF